MQAYKFNTFILENGTIFFPFFEPSFNKQEVEVIVLPVSEQNKENKIENILATKSFLNGNADLGNIYDMNYAANLLYSDYANDKELTAFTALDYENFYETK
jgi:hypothetical protein